MRTRIRPFATLWIAIASTCAAAATPAPIEVAAHIRTAWSYLRTGNIDLAAIEVEALKDRWITQQDAIDDPDLRAVGKAAITAALTAIDAGEPEPAKKQLMDLRRALHETRRAAGQITLDDCILDANDDGLPLWKFRDPAPDLSESAVAARIVWAAATYRHALATCDTITRTPVATAVANDPEYRRLMDGALESLDRIPEAVVTANSGLLFRLLIELRSIDRLLFFRYG